MTLLNVVRSSLVAAVAVVGLQATAVQATTITTSNGTAGCWMDQAMTMMADCEAYQFGAGGDNDDPGILADNQLGDVWDISAVTGSNANSEANEADFLNQVTGTTSFVAGDMDKTAGSDTPDPFKLSSLYLLIKIGAGHVVIVNEAAKSIWIDWDGDSAGGLSHQTQAGELPEVPVPAAGLLLVGGLGALGLVRRRRKA